MRPAGSGRPGGRPSSAKPRTEKAGAVLEDQPTSKERVEFVGGALAMQQTDSQNESGTPKNAARPGASIMFALSKLSHKLRGNNPQTSMLSLGSPVPQKEARASRGRHSMHKRAARPQRGSAGHAQLVSHGQPRVALPPPRPAPQAPPARGAAPPPSRPRPLRPPPPRPRRARRRRARCMRASTRTTSGTPR